MADNVPDDILILIFLLYLQVDPSDKTPVRLSHVCTAWRNLALHTGQLWTKLTFDMNYGPEGHVEPCVGFARQAEWMARSKGALLDIELKGFRTPYSESHTAGARARVQWVLDLLKPHARRWKTLGLIAGRLEEIENFFRQAGDLAVPSLITLEVLPSWGDRQGTIHSFKPGAAPSLRRLMVPRWLNFGRPFIGSLENLQHIDISLLNFSEDVVNGAKEIVALVRRSPQLEHLKLWGASPPRLLHWERPPESTRNVVTASKLTFMSIAAVNLQAAVLPFIHAPLMTSCPWSFRPDLLPIIHTYNPFPNLQSIRITHGGFPSPYPLSELAGLLSRLHALKVLSIFTLRAMEGDSDKEWIRQFSNRCPALRTLELDWGSWISGDAMKAMVEGRIDRGNPLASITLEVEDTSDIPEGLEPWLRDHVAEVVIAEDEGGCGFPLFD